MKFKYDRLNELPTEVAPGLFVHLPGYARFEGVELDGYQYSVSLLLDRTEEGIRPTEVSISAPEGSPPISSTTLRALTVHSLTQIALREIAQRGESGAHKVRTDGPTTALTDSEVAEIRAAGPVDSSLKAVARFYNLAVAMGEPPAKAVENALGLPRTTASKWVRRARDKGFLAETISGGRVPVRKSDPRPIDEVAAEVKAAQERWRERYGVDSEEAQREVPGPVA